MFCLICYQVNLKMNFLDEMLRQDKGAFKVNNKLQSLVCLIWFLIGSKNNIKHMKQISYPHPC